MSDDDYLWDPRSRGPRDPLVERLERKLQARQLDPPRRGFRPLVVLPLAAAAVVIGLVGWQAYGRGDASRSPAGCRRGPRVGIGGMALRQRGSGRDQPSLPGVEREPAGAETG